MSIVQDVYEAVTAAVAEAERTGDVATVDWLLAAKNAMLRTQPKHGTESCYVNRGCRCEACKEAHASYHRQWRKKATPPPTLRHGTLSAYANYSCRCGRCKAANSQYQRATREARRG